MGSVSRSDAGGDGEKHCANNVARKATNMKIEIEISDQEIRTIGDIETRVVRERLQMLRAVLEWGGKFYAELVKEPADAHLENLFGSDCECSPHTHEAPETSPED